MPDYDALAEGRKKEKQLRYGISVKNFWATPGDVFHELDVEFDFDLDAAATRESAKCKEYLGLDHVDPSRRDALSCRWPGRRSFLNMPYSPDAGGIFTWVLKAYLEAQDKEVVVLLLPGTADTEWAEYLWKQGAELRFTPRIAFIDPESGGRTAPMGGSLVAIIRPGQVQRDQEHPQLLADAEPIVFGYAPWREKKR